MRFTRIYEHFYITLVQTFSFVPQYHMAVNAKTVAIFAAEYGHKVKNG